MSTTRGRDAQGRLRTLVHHLNQAWLNRRFRELSRYFHPNMVILSPDTGKLVRGREACVKSYEQFMASSKVHRYKESRFQISTWRDAAVVSYHFEISYEWNGKIATDLGRDIFLLVRNGSRWTVAWRTLIPKQN